MLVDEGKGMGFTEWKRSEVRCEKGPKNVTGRSAVGIMTCHLASSSVSLNRFSLSL